MSATFMSALKSRWDRGRFLSVGLDPVYDRLPGSVTANASREDAIFQFNHDIVDATHDLVCAYKPNAAFYEVEGDGGVRALGRTIEYIKTAYPDLPVILDAKRGDIGHTNDAYARGIFDVLGADAVTVHPYLGSRALEPFLRRTDKGIIVLVKTSNPGSAEFQDLTVGDSQQPLHEIVAHHIATSWNEGGNCGIVVGAPYTENLRSLRAIVGDMPILIPGVGPQGGDLAMSVQVGLNAHGTGIIINSSRETIYASSESDFAPAARKVAEQLDATIRAQATWGTR